MFHSHMRPAATMDSCIIPENISEYVTLYNFWIEKDCKVFLTIHGPGKIVLYIEKWVASTWTFISISNDSLEIQPLQMQYIWARKISHSVLLQMIKNYCSEFYFFTTCIKRKGHTIVVSHSLTVRCQQFHKIFTVVGSMMNGLNTNMLCYIVPMLCQWRHKE